jgi:very-short-patch-repair endonuclease
MDFLILFSSRHRVVLEVDGKQHYANGDTASPALYSEMVSEDRRLRLAGYEVYRFGGAELMRDGADKMVAEFFDQLAERMR